MTLSAGDSEKPRPLSRRRKCRALLVCVIGAVPSLLLLYLTKVHVALLMLLGIPAVCMLMFFVWVGVVRLIPYSQAEAEAQRCEGTSPLFRPKLRAAIAWSFGAPAGALVSCLLYEIHPALGWIGLPAVFLLPWCIWNFLFGWVLPSTQEEDDALFVVPDKVY